jgi:DNA mismatch endonuclease (patch repair protein)
MGATTSKRRDPAVTSRMMAAVRNKDSQAELLLRRALHARGVRYRLHARDVLGKPDIVVRARRVAVFVDGDFWHGNAHRLRGLDSIEDLFPTNREWWTKKLRRTMERDREVTARLEAGGWSVLRFWESDILRDPAKIADRVQLALRAT